MHNATCHQGDGLPNFIIGLSAPGGEDSPQRCQVDLFDFDSSRTLSVVSADPQVQQGIRGVRLPNISFTVMRCTFEDIKY